MLPIMTESADHLVDLTSNKYSCIFKISNPAQEKPANDGVGAMAATSPKTCKVPASETTIRGSVKAAPEIFEIDD
jgi:hypothetical protein